MCLSIFTFLSKFFIPLNGKSILDAMLWKTRNFSNCAHWIIYLWWQSTHCTFIAARFKWNNNSCLSCKTFSTTINKPDLCCWVWVTIFIKLNKLMNSLVHPSSSFNIIQARNDDLEISVKFNLKFLDCFSVKVYCTSWYTLHYKLSGSFGFKITNIFLSEQKLPVEICKINCIHIYDSDLLDAT